MYSKQLRNSITGFLLAGILFTFLLSGCTPEQKIDIPLPEHPIPNALL